MGRKKLNPAERRASLLLKHTGNKRAKSNNQPEREHCATIKLGAEQAASR